MRRLYPDRAYLAEPDSGNFWQSTIDTPIPAALEGDTTTEVAIIGAGYTGLNAALQLSEKYGVESIVLDAAWPGWGASGRNGGFACIGGSKLSDQKMVRKFGEVETKAFCNSQRSAIDVVSQNLESYGLDADACGNGEYYLAHRPSDFADMPDEADRLKTLHGADVPILTPEELKDRGIYSPAFHGGIHVPFGFGLNPLKYVLGLSDAAQTQGVRIFGKSPVQNITRQDDGYILHTPKGSVKAKKVLFATNGYSVDGLPDALSGWFVPILSNILVTRPLTPEEQKAQGWTAVDPVADTRNLLHYVRLLPDGRFLFGMRGGTGLTPRDEAKMRHDIRASFEELYPEWAHIETPYFWSGLACLSRGLAPYIGPLSTDGQYAALAYHGGGVAMASWSGRRVADIISGKMSANDLSPVLRQPITKFPFPAFRRHYLKAAYAWYEWKDR